MQIAPSILSANFADLKSDIRKVEEGGAALLHVDVMDGHFVPNLTIGPPVVRCLSRETSLPLDVHLMIEDAARYIEEFLQAGAGWVSVHWEGMVHLHRTVQSIKDGGALAGVAINPATPVSVLEEILPEVDFVLLMSVNPGFGGQKFIDSSYEKIRKLKRMIEGGGWDARIEVDGGIGPDNVRQVVECGAEVIVAGSSIFHAPDIQRAVAEMIRAVEAQKVRA
ncbi:MAG: ribulose-phosphate 3-epimerase [Acidobacteria bacterium]|nr:ribulose-phosphate 3-epimerase [Acidobacteriota bacterium]